MYNHEKIFLPFGAFTVIVLYLIIPVNKSNIFLVMSKAFHEPVGSKKRITSVNSIIKQKEDKW